MNKTATAQRLLTRFHNPYRGVQVGVCLSGLVNVFLASTLFGQTPFDPYQRSLPLQSPVPVSQGPPVFANGSILNGSIVNGPIVSGSHLNTEGWLPPGTIFTEYLADEKASRMSGRWLGSDQGSALLDGTLGGKFALFRRGPLSQQFGTPAFEVAVEGSAQLRIDLDNHFDLRSTDYRLGLPLAYRVGRWNQRFGYYHLSSHLGDEFQLANPTYERLNFSRDALFFGVAYSLWNAHRLYGEISWGFATEISEPIDFKFGIERFPLSITPSTGEFFWAIHGHLREELDFGGHFTAQTGWAWRQSEYSGMLRIGLHYYNGKSSQYSFFNQHEHQLGLGFWYDY